LQKQPDRESNITKVKIRSIILKSDALKKFTIDLKNFLLSLFWSAGAKRDGTEKLILSKKKLLAGNKRIRESINNVRIHAGKDLWFRQESLNGHPW